VDEKRLAERCDPLDPIDARVHLQTLILRFVPKPII